MPKSEHHTTIEGEICQFCRYISDLVQKMVESQVIRQNNQGPIKIGYSKEPGSRIEQMQTGHPDELYLLCQIPGEKEDEKNIHKCFEYCHLRGEWYSPDPDLLWFIAQCADKFDDANWRKNAPILLVELAYKHPEWKPPGTPGT